MSIPEGYEQVLKELEGRIRSDFEAVLPNLALRFITYAAWVSDDPVTSALPVEDDIVCVASGSSFPIQIADGVETGCWRAAHELQDQVMDDLQRPWPAFEVDGSLLVPIPDLDPWGKACWQVESRFRCPVGYLRSALRIFGAID
jgi:hypothetical protein